jgi:two-component system, NtrC family, response regulator AlgB
VSRVLADGTRRRLTPMNLTAPLTTNRAQDLIPVVSNPSVLVVDSDSRLLKLWRHRLADAGYEVAAFETFSDARRYLSTHRPDALFTDIRLGAFNGLQLIVVAKSMYPGIVTAVITGYDDPVLRRDAARFGAEFLTKPVSPRTVLTYLRSRLNGGQASFERTTD